MQVKWRYVLLLGAGVVTGLGQAPIDLLAATIVGLMLVILAQRVATNPKQAFLQVWVFGLGYFAFSLRWIIEPFLVDIARHGWMAPFALILMGAGGGLFWAIAAYLAKRTAPHNMILFALALVWAELARSYIFTGFPWVLLGHSLINTPLAQLAAFGGPHLLTLIVVLTAYLLARPYNFSRPFGDMRPSQLALWRLQLAFQCLNLELWNRQMRPPPLSAWSNPMPHSIRNGIRLIAIFSCNV